MKRVIISIGFMLMISASMSSVGIAQKEKIVFPGGLPEADLYFDNGQYYSTMVKCSFTGHILDFPKNISRGGKEAILPAFPIVANRFAEIERRWGKIFIEKVFPFAHWGDSLLPNERSGSLVKVPDLSQDCRVIFDSPIPVDSVVNELKRIPFVKFAGPPGIAINLTSPNDPIYTAGGEWNLSKIQAEKAWDLTRGLESVVIAIPDVGRREHEDILDKIVGGDGGDAPTDEHGTGVAGIAAGCTNNTLGIASLGWNLRLATYFGTQYYPVSITAAVNSGYKVINMSWAWSRPASRADMRNGCLPKGFSIPYDDTHLSDAINYAMAYNVIFIAAAGNLSVNAKYYWPNGTLDPACDPVRVPYLAWPAAYSIDQRFKDFVVAVSATDSLDRFYDYDDGGSFNWGSFVTVAAPGINIWVPYSSSSIYETVNGTSVASPLTCALVGLMRSICSALSPSQIKDILRLTSERVDASRHPYDSDGWNEFLGYGRINAYAALKYTIEHYSTTLGGVNTSVVFHENFSTASGTTLTIQPGTTVKLDPGVVLNINGQLVASGSSSQPITFDRTGTSGTWNGIALLSGSSATLNYCNFTNAYAALSCFTSNAAITNCSFTNSTVGVVCGALSPTINGCTFLNDYFGLYISGCTPLIENNDIRNCTNSGMYLTNASPTIQSNNIRTNATNGIWCYSYSSPTLINNTFAGNGCGIYSDHYSSPSFGAPFVSGNNVVSANGCGVYANYYSNPFLGVLPMGGCGYNSIYSNSGYDVSAYYSSYVRAERNWWGVNPPNSNKFYSNQSTIVYSNALPSDPNPGRPKINALSVAASGPTSDSTFNLAYQDGLGGKYDDAIELYLQVFKGARSTPILAKQALVFMAEVYERSGKTDFISCLQNQISPIAAGSVELTVIIRELEAHWLVKAGKYVDAIAMYQALHTDFASTPDIDKFALFNIGEIYSSYLGDHAHAIQALKLFQTKYSNDPLSGVASFLMTSVSPVGYSQQKDGGAISTKAPNPTGYGLESNYPNPFNPSTQISYSLPEAGKVSLMIYDVLGREVATLADGYQQAGRYSVIWNSKQKSGTHVSSGVYFTRLRVLNDLGAVTFTKTTKLLLTK